MKAKNIFLKTSFLMLVLLFFSFLFHLSSKPAYALTGHRIVPLVFYGNNSNYPDDNYLNKLNAALSTIQGYYRNLLGETFYFEPARRYFANSSKEYFGNTDYFGCGEIRVFCNVESEMIFNEKDTLKLFGVSNSGFGWSDRAVMVFTHDTSGTSDYAWGYTYMPTNTSLGVTWAIFNDPVLNSIAGDPGTCSATIVAQHYTNAICGIVAHELGHEFGLPHSCDVQADLMCPTLGASGTDTFPYATLRSIDQVTAKNSPFTYLTSDPNTGPPGFCFSSDSINSWCTGAGVFHLKVGSTSYPTSGTSSSITNTNPDCCRSNYSPRVTLGGFILEWCIANTTRGSPYCQKRSGLVTTYSQTIGLQPLNSNGQPLYYDIYVDYQTIQSGIVPWKVMKGVNQLCFASSCNYTVTWAKPYFSAKLNQAGTSTSACTGYSNCVDTVASFPEDNPFPKFTSLPPDLPVDLTVQVRPMENSGAIVNHWIAKGLVTPTCSLKNPTAPTVPFNSSGVLTGIGGNQSVSLSWAAPNNWGVECNYTNPREYLIAIGQTNPPPFYGKTTANNITISNLNPGTTYYWAIAAENQANLWGPYTYVQSFTTAPPVATNNFTGEYFDNIDFTNKKIVRTDQKISFNWGANSPDTSIAVDTFSIRWTGTFNFDSAKYRFNANVNDKVVVYVDNDLVLDGSVGSATYNQLKNISAGVHTVRIEYIENTDSANITANWVHADTCYDMDGNGAVNLNDILIVQKHLGAIGLSPWDLNGDKMVSSVDTDLVRTSVGKLCQ